jgi:periplasmic protein TonB
MRAPSLALGGQAAIVLPPSLQARAFAPAWALAVAAHLAVTGAVAIAPASRLHQEPPIRLVFVEPPPPPPALVGTSTGAATSPVPAEAPPVSRADETPKPAPSERERLRRPVPGSTPRPRVGTRPRPAVVPPSPPAAGAVAGATSGEASGMMAGITGGIAGGVPGGTGTAPVPATQVAHPPEVIRRVRPVYPAEARRREIEGLVVIEAVLDRDGRIEQGVKVLQSVPLLDAEAVAAVRQWRFRPARNAAREPLRVILEIPIRFVLT